MMRLFRKILFLLMFLVGLSTFAENAFSLPRVIVCTDIGGTDPDDFQSMIHYLMYADCFETEGLISSPPGNGRKQHILQIIDHYEKDYPILKRHSANYPTADQLRLVTKQGAIDRAPGKGWANPTEGSDWIIKCAKAKSDRPLWILAWGGLEDLAQALHDDPGILPFIRVYWIAGPNKKWSADAYRYIVQNFHDLWMIEANSTYRGWFLETDNENDYKNKQFYEQFISGHGALGNDFANYYQGIIKMGDSPSVAYLLNGDPEKPEGQSWGGSFVPLKYAPLRIFNRMTTLSDQVPVFCVVEWAIKIPETETLEIDKPCLWLEIKNQRFEGYYEGNGICRVRFVPKETGNWKYRISSSIVSLNGLNGEFTSIDQWPGKPHPENILPLNNWWTDNPDPALRVGPHSGAKTVGKWRQDFLGDWGKRWIWLEMK